MLTVCIFCVLLFFVVLPLIVNKSKHGKYKEEKESYEELLDTPEWKAKRASILMRDGYRCVYCGCDDCKLHVHHKYYLQYPDNEKVYPWEYPDDALISLCSDCHKKVHEKKKIKVYYRSWY